ncbi:MAG: helix-turn-helix domain-containing protein [Pseudomonadota bacterium]
MAVAATSAPKESRSIWRALDLLGDWATLLTLEGYWLGARRFSELQTLTGLPKTVLSSRLKTLVGADLLRRHAYSVRPPRSEYRGTKKLMDLFPAALAMFQWEQRWGHKDSKWVITLTHKMCGETMVPLTVCGHCHQDLSARDCAWTAGPSADLIHAGYARRRRRSDQTPVRSGLLDTCFQTIGDRWSGLILHSVFCGINRYDDLLGATRAASNILSDRLKWLCQAKILRRLAYQNAPARFAYRLSDRGRELYPILVALLTWGNRWYPAAEGPPILLSHRTCGEPLKLAFVCSACRQPLALGDIDSQVEARSVSLARVLPASAIT